MKIKKKRLREIVHGIVKEAAKQGLTQKIYKKSFNDMIATVWKVWYSELDYEKDHAPMANIFI